MKCNWLKNHVSMDVNGDLRPCCSWRNTGNSYNVTDNISQYTNSAWVKTIEDTLDNNEWPSGCADCKFEEENNVESLRYTGINKYSNKRDAEVKFGNLCNLACMMCSPTNSSLIDLEIRTLKNTADHEFINNRSLFNSNSNNSNWYDDPKLLSEVAEFMSDRDEIRFTGGEPTVSNYLVDFLDVLIKNNSKATIRLTTNANNWPKKLTEKLSNFKVNVDLSIDGYKEINEYIRWPSKWSKIEKNIKEIKTIAKKISCFTTVSCYNLHTLPNLCRWAEEESLDHLMNTTITPGFMNPSHCNSYSKDIFYKLCETYEPARKIKNIVEKPGNIENLTSVYNYFKILDKHRKQDSSVLGYRWREIN